MRDIFEMISILSVSVDLLNLNEESEDASRFDRLHIPFKSMIFISFDVLVTLLGRNGYQELKNCFVRESKETMSYHRLSFLHIITRECGSSSCRFHP